MTTNTSLLHRMKSLGACSDSWMWLESQPNMKAAWHTCERGDWMLWYAVTANMPSSKVVLAACSCAKLSLDIPYQVDDLLYVSDKAYSWPCLALAEQWALGDKSVSLDDLDPAFREIVDLRISTKWRANDASRFGYTLRSFELSHPSEIERVDRYENETLKAAADVCRQFWPDPPPFPHKKNMPLEREIFDGHEDPLSH